MYLAITYLQVGHILESCILTTVIGFEVEEVFSHLEESNKEMNPKKKNDNIVFVYLDWILLHFFCSEYSW